MRKERPNGTESTSIKDYEELLQKAEAKIRTFVRVSDRKETDAIIC